MNWRGRIMFYGAIVVIAIALVISAKNKYQQTAQHAWLLVTNGVSVEAAPSEPAIIAPDAMEENHVQAPASLADVSPAIVPVPKEDLLLTGVSGLTAKRRAFFVIKVPGEADYRFSLREGEQNDWLEVLSIDPQSGTVKTILKKPVVRVRNVGVEVVLSFKTHGAIY